jgi:hypothetical protein
MYTNRVIRYEPPKTAEKHRPMSSCSLEGQMLLIAMTWVRQHVYEEQFDRCGEVSFGYRLNDQADEFLYEHWFRCHRRFVQAVLRTLRHSGRSYLQGDIAQFFDSIQRDKLCNRLLEGVEAREVIYRTIWEQHLRNGCWSGTSADRGLLQGHAVSGFLSNVFLHSFDEEVCMTQGFRGRYFRYVDDMIWIYNQEPPPSNCPPELEAILSRKHGLEINVEKVLSGNEEEYARRALDPELHALATRTHVVIRPVYRLRYSAFAAFRRNKQGFCGRYSQLLAGVGVFVSPWHLIRKLRRQGALGERLRRLIGLGARLVLPEVPALFAEKPLSDWAEEFRNRNPNWPSRNRPSQGIRASPTLKV